MITEEDTIEKIFIDECKSISVMDIYDKIKSIKRKNLYILILFSKIKIV